jgi:hypothetical protein
MARRQPSISSSSQVSGDRIVIAGEKVRTWTVLVTSRTDDLVLTHSIVEETPSANHLWDTLVQAMQKPAAGESHRPIQLQVRTDQRWASLKLHIEEIATRRTKHRRK